MRFVSFVLSSKNSLSGMCGLGLDCFRSRCFEPQFPVEFLPQVNDNSGQHLDVVQCGSKIDDAGAQDEAIVYDGIRQENTAIFLNAFQQGLVQFIQVIEAVT